MRLTNRRIAVPRRQKPTPGQIQCGFGLWKKRPKDLFQKILRFAKFSPGQNSLAISPRPRVCKTAILAANMATASDAACATPHAANAVQWGPVPPHPALRDGRPA